MQRGSKENVAFLWAISGGQKYIEKESYELYRQGQNVFFSNNVSLNLDTMDCVIKRDNHDSVPQSIFYIRDGKLEEKQYADFQVSTSVLVIDRAGKFSSIIADRQFLTSLIFKLYYLDGQGLKFFKKFSYNEELKTKARIFVYEIDWKNYLSLE